MSCVPPRSAYFRLGVWDSALAAAAFSALVLEGFARTLPALDAADLPVCLVFFGIVITSFRPWSCSRHLDG